MSINGANPPNEITEVDAAIPVYIVGGSSSGGVTQLIAGTNVTLSPSSGVGAVTVNASGGGGSGTISQITSTGGTITVTNGTGPTVNLEAVGVPLSSLTDGVGVGALADIIAFEHLANSTTYKLTLGELFGFDSVKQPVNGVYTTNVSTLSGIPAAGTPDGVTLTAGQYVLLTANGASNGPWQVNSGAWTRPPWYTTGATGQAYAGVTVQSLGGTVNGGTTWALTTTGAVTIDTTVTTWSRIPLSSSGIAAGGASTNVQYNASGSAAGDSGFTYTSGTRTLTLGDTTAAGVFTTPTSAGASAGLDLSFKGGAASGTGDGGSLLLYGGKPAAGNGGAIVFYSGNGVGINKSGGVIAFYAGNATGTGIGANFQLSAGTSVNGDAGGLNASAGSASGSGSGGGFSLTSGNSGTGAGGAFSLNAGFGATGGSLQLVAGAGTAAANNSNDGTISLQTAQGFVVVVDQNANLIAGAGLAGGGGGGGFVDQGYYLMSPVPVTGQTFTVPAFSGSAVFNPAGALATQTIKLPSTPIDGQIFEISVTQTITTATWQDGAGAANVLNPPANPVSPGGYSWRYISSLGKWLRRF